MSAAVSTGRRTRELLLAAALEAFDRQGYASTSLSDIRRSTGVSTGSLYHHFASKEHLTAALVADGIDDYQGLFLASLDEASDAQSGIRGGVVFHLDWARRNRALSRLLLAALDADIVAATTADAAARRRRFMREVHSWLADHARAGEIVELPRELYYPVWIGPAQEFVRQWLVGRRRMTASARGQLAGHAWRSLRA